MRKKKAEHKYPATVSDACVERVRDTRNHILKSAYMGERNSPTAGGRDEIKF